MPAMIFDKPMSSAERLRRYRSKPPVVVPPSVTILKIIKPSGVILEVSCGGEEPIRVRADKLQSFVDGLPGLPIGSEHLTDGNPAV